MRTFSMTRIVELTRHSVKPVYGLFDEALVQRIGAATIVNAEFCHPNRDAVHIPDRLDVVLQAGIDISGNEQ
jgi:hypothetical protein